MRPANVESGQRSLVAAKFIGIVSLSGLEIDVADEKRGTTPDRTRHRCGRPCKTSTHASGFGCSMILRTGSSSTATISCRRKSTGRDRKGLGLYLILSSILDNLEHDIVFVLLLFRYYFVLARTKLSDMSQYVSIGFHLVLAKKY